MNQKPGYDNLSKQDASELINEHNNLTNERRTIDGKLYNCSEKLVQFAIDNKWYHCFKLNLNSLKRML